METTQAIQDILKTAIEAGKLQVEATTRLLNLTVDDQGTELDVPVALIPDANGAMKAVTLLDQVKAGIALARAKRLDEADGPDFRAGTAEHQALTSLIAHAKRFADQDSAVWADPTARTIVSVLDYHKAGAGGDTRWGRHRGTYSCPLSDAWKRWGGLNGLELDQEAFALHLDKYDGDLSGDGGSLSDGSTPPSPAQLLSIANKLEGWTEHKAKRERDPNSGRLKVAFSTESGFAGDIMPPRAFRILIPVFQDSAPRPLEVRLYANVEDGSATFELKIHAAEDVLRGSFESLVDRVGVETSLPVFLGKPE